MVFHNAATKKEGEITRSQEPRQKSKLEKWEGAEAALGYGGPPTTGSWQRPWDPDNAGSRRGLQTAGGRGTGTKQRHESLSLISERGTRSFCTSAQERDKKFGHLCILGRGKYYPEESKTSGIFHMWVWKNIIHSTIFDHIKISSKRIKGLNIKIKEKSLATMHLE